MALIFVPATAAIGVMVMTNFGNSPTAGVASLVFATLAMGVVVGLLKLARRWEDETP